MDEDKKPQGKRYKTMDPLSRVFATSETAGRIFGNEGFRFFLFQNRWKDMVGPILAKESYVSGFKGDVLYVNVTNSVFLSHLFMMKAELLEQLANDEWGSRFHDIRFFAGAPRQEGHVVSSLTPINEAIRKQKAMYSETLTEGEQEWISNWTDTHVKSEALRPAFSGFMGEVLKIRKAERKNGYTPCPLCGALKPPDQKFCPACARRLKHAQKSRVVLLLKAKPHLTFQEVRALTPCDYSLYEESRDRLVDIAKDHIYHHVNEEEEKKFIIALLLHKPMSSISKEEADERLSRLPTKERC